MAAQPIHWRPSSDDLRAKVVARAAAKGLSVNEWLNRAVTHALLRDGTYTLTTTTTEKIEL